MTQDKYASELDACQLLDQADNYGTLKENDETIDETMESQRMIKKIDKLPNLKQYFNDALDSEVESRTIILIDKPYEADIDEKDISPTKSREVRSSTVYTRSDSENSNIYIKSPSRGSSSTIDLDYLRQRYNRTDSSNSFIQDELDSEEYHHNQRFSMTAETLEYIRGRDDWRVHSENNNNNIFSRQSSNISIREEIDSDEYHHDRKLSDLIEIAFLDVNTIEQSLPSNFKDAGTFDRYYLELQQINGQLSSDIEQNIAKKQIVLLDSNEVQPDGYLYPLPDIILDQIDDHNGVSYVVEQIDSDYSNLSDSEDDIQSVIEVNHEGEIITTLDMSGDFDEMIEVTLWDLKDDKELSSKESSVEIISMPNENSFGVNELASVDQSSVKTSNKNISDTDYINLKTVNLNYNISTTYEPNENNNNNSIAMIDVPENVTLVTQSETTNIKNIGTNAASENTENLFENNKHRSLGGKSNENVSDTTIDSKTTKVKDETVKIVDSNEKPRETSPRSSVQTNLGVDSPQTKDQRTNHHSSTAIEMSKSFIEHENITSVKASPSLVETSTNSKKSEIKKKVTSYENVDDLVQEGCMGVWFHN